MRQPAAGGQNSSVGPPPVAITGSPQAIASSTGMREALAAVGVHEHVAGAVERGELVVGELVVEQHDARQRAARGVRARSRSRSPSR